MRQDLFHDKEKVIRLERLPDEPFSAKLAQMLHLLGIDIGRNDYDGQIRIELPHKLQEGLPLDGGQVQVEKDEVGDPFLNLRDGLRPARCGGDLKALVGEIRTGCLQGIRFVVNDQDSSSLFHGPPPIADLRQEECGGT